MLIKATPNNYWINSYYPRSLFFKAKSSILSL